MGVVSILAAMGDTGKGMMTLDLALSVATGKSPFNVSVSPEPMSPSAARCANSAPPSSLPLRTTRARCIAVCNGSIPKEVPPRSARNDLIVVPLPNAGGPIPLVVSMARTVPEITPQFRMVRDQIMRLSVISSWWCSTRWRPSSMPTSPRIRPPAVLPQGLLGEPRHGNRRGGDRRPSYAEAPGQSAYCTSVEQARDAVRGTSAIVDGVRMVYALWPAPDEHQSLRLQGARRGLMPVMPCLPRCGGQGQRSGRSGHPHISARAEPVFLVDATERLREHAAGQCQDLLDMPSSTAVIQAAAERRPSVHPYRRHSGVCSSSAIVCRFCSTTWRRNKIERPGSGPASMPGLAVLVKGMAEGSKELKWLDVPAGPFARGVGQFVHGAHRRPEE